MTWDLWTFIFGLVGALAVLVPPMLYLGRRLHGLSMFTDPRLNHFLDDWFGEPARPGVPARPGAMERLACVENDTKQLQRNGGSHLADAVARMETHLSDVLTGQLSAAVSAAQRDEHATEHEATQRGPGRESP